MRVIFIFYFFTTPLAFAKTKEKKIDFAESTATLTASKMSADQDSPWFITPEDSVQGLATYIGNNLFITTSGLAARSTQISLKMMNDSKKFTVTPVHVDIERGLAIVKAENLPPTLPPAIFSGDVKEGVEVNFLVRKFKSTQISRFSGRIFDVVAQRAPGGLSFLPFYLVKSQSKYSGRGEPVYVDNQLAGITVGLDDDSMMVVPARLIKECLNQYEKKQPPAISRLGIMYHSLQSPHHRAYLRVPQNVDGVVVEKIFDTKSPFKKDDVITKIAGYPIDNEGNIRHPDWGIIHFSAMIIAHDIQDKIEVKVFRQGEEVMLDTGLINVDPDQYLIPSLLQTIEVPYFVFAGLVFRNLDLQYLEGFGREWYKKAPAHFLKLWFYSNDFEISKKRVVVLQRVLPDTVNLGFETEENLILTRVNNETCESLSECEKLMRKSLGKHKDFTSLRFTEGSEFVVLNDDALQAEKRIHKLYQIP